MTMTLVPALPSPGSACSTALAQQILDTFPSGSYALTALLRLLDIEASSDVETAAVQCRIQPRLLINPAFVASHAQTPEKLLMLVMHELHHVLLGHTTLFPRCTRAQNFVFDAVINGIICRMFEDPAYTAFLTDYYDSNVYPLCLLRPPPGWPHTTRRAGALATLPTELASRIHAIHLALYSSAGASYQEVFEALPNLLPDLNSVQFTLLGSHHGKEGGELQQTSPLLFDAVRGIVEQWPQPPDPIQGRSLADILKYQTIHPDKVPATTRQLLRGLMRKVANIHGAGRARQRHNDCQEVITPVPSLSRRSMVLHAIGVAPLLHTGTVAWRHPVRQGARVHVYLDVSGSMDDVLRELYGAVLDCADHVHSTIHLFSSKVADVSLSDLRRGVCHSTGGTEIACVAEHMREHGVRRAVLVTDGWVGIPRGGHLEALSQVRLGVAYLGEQSNQTDLQAVATHTVVLPQGV